MALASPLKMAAATLPPGMGPSSFPYVMVAVAQELCSRVCSDGVGEVDPAVQKDVSMKESGVAIESTEAGRMPDGRASVSVASEVAVKSDPVLLDLRLLCTTQHSCSRL